MKTPLLIAALVFPSLSLAADLDPAIGDPIAVSSSASSRPSTAALADSFAITWSDANGDVRVALLAEGAVVRESVLGRGRAPVVASNGSELAVAWIADDVAVELARVSVSGDVIETRRVGEWSGREETLALAAAPGGWLLLRKHDGAVIADRLAPDGSTTSSVTLATFPGPEYDPGIGSLASDDAGVIAVWHEFGEPRVARVTASGNDALASPLGFAARVASGSAGFRLALMGRTGTPALKSLTLDGKESDVAVGADLTVPALAFDGAMFLVAVEQYSNVDHSSRVVGARLSPEGTTLEQPERPLFVLAEEKSSAPSVAAREGASIVAYRVGDSLRARIVTRGDGVDDAADNCVARGNMDQRDTDGDGIGDACEDVDADGVADVDDACPTIADASNADGDGDGIGDACDPDTVASGSRGAPEAPVDEIDLQAGVAEPQGGCCVAATRSSLGASVLLLLALAGAALFRRAVR